MFIPIRIADYLSHAVQHFPDKIAVIYQHKQFSYAHINNESNKLAERLIAKGLGYGDRVIVSLENSIDLIIIFWALQKIGAIVSIVNPGIARQKLMYIIRDAGAKMFFGKNNPELFEELQKNNKSLGLIIALEGEVHHSANGVISISELLYANSVSESQPLISKSLDIDLSAIIYTSGSTGTPKGVMLTHRNMLAASYSINSYLRLTHDDVIISALPMSFDYGLYQMILACMNGATLVLEKDFAWPIHFLKQMAVYGATVFPGVPTMFSILANHAKKHTFDLSKVRSVTNTGAMLLRRHVDIIKQLFARADIYSMYGLTECKRCTYLPPKDIDVKTNSVGVAIPNTEIWIVDENHRRLPAGEVGQLVIRGATVMKGYWNKPIETEKVLKEGVLPGEKVLYTGDYGYLDKEGYFYFCGRMDDVIKSFGEKVNLKEVEEFIYLHPYVKEVAAIAVADEYAGDAIVLYVSCDYVSEQQKQELLRQCKQMMPRNHWPKEIILMNEIPKNINGKLDKVALKNSYVQQQVAMNQYQFSQIDVMLGGS